MSTRPSSVHTKFVCLLAPYVSLHASASKMRGGTGRRSERRREREQTEEIRQMKMQIYCNKARRARGKRGDVGGSGGSGDTDARGCLIHLPRMHAHFSFLIHFQSLSHHPCETMDLIPHCFPRLHLFLILYPTFFFYYHTLPLTTCSLRWEAIRLTSFSLAILLFSPPRLRFFFLLLISISVLVSSRCAVMDVTCGVRGEGGMFFNLPPLPKTIQLASHCLNNSRIALVKVLFMIEVKCTWD